MLGETNVGKSTILNKFTDNLSQDSVMPTIGINYKIKEIKVADANNELQRAKFHILDSCKPMFILCQLARTSSQYLMIRR